MDLKAELKDRFKGPRGVTILGIGSELRGDDVAGVLVAKELDRWACANKDKGVTVLFGWTAPENFTSQIKKADPGVLLIVDSASMGKPAGEVRVLESGEIGGISFSTHSLPLKVMIDYIRPDLRGQIIVIGIQPKAVAFGSEVSKEVKNSVRTVSETIKELLTEER